MNQPAMTPPPLQGNSMSHGGPSQSDTATARLPQDKARTFPCEQCGADMEFSIGQQNLSCSHCGFSKEIKQDNTKSISENDLLSAVQKQRTENKKTNVGACEVRCQSCGGVVTFEEGLTSSECCFCGSPIQRNDVHQSEERLPVDGMLPFIVDHQNATRNLRSWVSGLWFAPNDFKQRGVNGNFKGVYFPFYTFDAMTFTYFSGERGEHYYEEVKQDDGTVQQIQKTRWHHVSGSFQRFFDDVIVSANTKGKGRIFRNLEPWPLEKIRPFDPSLMAGKYAMAYDTELKNGYGTAKQRMDDQLHYDVRRRIGGDAQKVHSIDSRYDALTYKHVMLPVWMLAYRYQDKSYQVVVNACTGEVQGERPYSVLKIAAAVTFAIAIAAAAFYFFGK